MNPRYDLTGKRYNMLTVLHPMGRTSWGSRLWMCRCDCGNKIVLLGHTLTNGNIISCGCTPKTYTHVCEVCGKEFVTTVAAKKVCSDECKRIRDRRTNQGSHYCLWCSNNVIERGAFCSEWCRQCYEEAHIRRKKVKPLKLTIEQELNYGENHKYSATVVVPEGLISYNERKENE